MWSLRITVLLSTGILFAYHQLHSKSLLPNTPSSLALPVPTGVLQNLFGWFALFTVIRYASIIAQGMYEDYRARKLGARRVPRIEGWLPANFDIFWYLMTQNPTEEPGEAFTKFHEKYGPLLAIRMFGGSMVSTIDPSHMQRILAGNFDNYGKPIHFLECFQDILGEGVFNSDQRGLWKWHRTLTRPHFAREEVFNYNHFLPYADRFVSHFVKKAQTNTPVNAQEVFALFTSDSGTALFFGKEFGALDRLDDGGTGKVKEEQEFWEAFMGAQAHGLKRLTRSRALWRIWELYGLLKPNRNNMRIIAKHLDAVIEQAINSPRDVKQDSKKEKTLLMHLISETQDVKLIRDELLNILIAARDTTASLLTSITNELALHPDAFAKLKAEILEVIGDDPTHVPTYEEMKNAPFTRAVIHETLRMWPPVFVNARFAWNEDVWTVNGTRYYIPPNTACRYGIGTMQTLESTWGPDAKEWIPERWLDSRIKFMTSQPFVFQPFSYGPRICLGQKFALNETTFALARMMQRITSVSLATDVQPPETIRPDGDISKKAGLTLANRGGLWVRFGTDDK